MPKMRESHVNQCIGELQTQLRDDGYLFIRSFFPENLIKNARDRVISVLNSEGWGEFDDKEFIAVAPSRRLNSPEFYQCITNMMKEECLHDISRYPSLLWFLSALLTEPIFSHPRKMLRITYPFAMNPKDRIPAHQDLFYVKGERDTFTCWIPLGDYPPEDGGLEVSPKTHKLGLLKTSSNDEGRFGCNVIEDDAANFSWVTAHYRPGDLLVMHSLTLHRSGLNQTKRFRLSLDCRFSSVNGAINEEQLLPPYSPHVPEWKILSQKWKKPDIFSTIPQSLKIDSKEKPLAEVMKTPTRFCE